jgi:hypothetical protein
MENYNNIVTDITYVSGLILDIKDARDLIRPASCPVFCVAAGLIKRR